MVSDGIGKIVADGTDLGEGCGDSPDLLVIAAAPSTLVPIAPHEITDSRGANLRLSGAEGVAIVRCFTLLSEGSCK